MFINIDFFPQNIKISMNLFLGLIDCIPNSLSKDLKKKKITNQIN